MKYFLTKITRIADSDMIFPGTSTTLKDSNSFSGESDARTSFWKIDPPTSTLPVDPTVTGISHVPVVPETVGVWETADSEVLTQEEKTKLDLLDVLNRLNLTSFLELVERAGLNRTLNLDGKEDATVERERERVHKTLK